MAGKRKKLSADKDVEPRKAVTPGHSRLASNAQKDYLIELGVYKTKDEIPSHMSMRRASRIIRKARGTRY